MKNNLFLNERNINLIVKIVYIIDNSKRFKNKIARYDADPSEDIQISHKMSINKQSIRQNQILNNISTQ